MCIRIIKPSVEILTNHTYEDILGILETAGRTCYKSDSPLTISSGERFLKTIIKNGHESVLEHASITFKFICSRSCSHQLVRHRIAAHSQESQRFCNYNKRNLLEVICPDSILNHECLNEWKLDVEGSYLMYKDLMSKGIDKEDARSVLPNCTKTEIVTTMNIRSLRHFLKLRTDIHAQEEIRYLATTLLTTLKDKYPVLFEDL